MVTLLSVGGEENAAVNDSRPMRDAVILFISIGAYVFYSDLHFDWRSIRKFELTAQFFGPPKVSPIGPGVLRRYIKKSETIVRPYIGIFVFR